MIRFATVGIGWIVGEFLRGAKEVPEVEYVACYSRGRERGELFAREWGAQKVYTDLSRCTGRYNRRGVHRQPKQPAL